LADGWRLWAPVRRFACEVEAAPSNLSLSDVRPGEFLKACTGLKKDGLAAKVESACAGAPYVPDLLISRSAVQLRKQASSAMTRLKSVLI